MLERLAPGARIAVIRLRSLGDCVLTTPALKLLKESRPGLDIAVVADDSFAPVFTGNPDLTLLRPSLSELRRWRPDLCVNLHGGTRSAQLTIGSGAALRAGFTHFRFQRIYNIRIPTAQQILRVNRKVHTAEHLASAMFYLGVPQTEIPRAQLFAPPARHARPYAVLHPFASAPDKTWPAQNFISIAEHLESEMGLEPILIGGPADDLSPFHRFRCLHGEPLEQVKSWIAGASLFLGNDSGPAHIAAAFGIPVIVLFGSSDRDIWSPWKTESIVLSHADGIAALPPAEVLHALESLRVKA